MSEFSDILWLEDKQQIKDFYPDSYVFRVDLQRRMLPLLKALKDEKNFSKYSCAVLDINLENGVVKEDFKEIKQILEENQIRIIDEHDPEEVDSYSPFIKNSGYYVYLYLIRRGMPSTRICMLTGNKGDEGEENLTENWEEPFENAGLVPPKAFDRTLEVDKFHKWLEKTLTPAFRLRSCIIALSVYAKKILDDEILRLNNELDSKNLARKISDLESRKVLLQNLYRIPLRLSEDKKVASPEFITALWQIVQPWESLEIKDNAKDKHYAYQTTLKTTRNWLAHLCLEKMSLLTVAFLFGIGLRGLLGENESIRIQLNTSPKNEYTKGYKQWESELIKLIEDLDKLSIGKKEWGAIVIESCQEFFVRIRCNKEKELKIEMTTDICSLIAQTVGQKKNKLEIYEEDLLRDFLHGVCEINWEGDGKLYDNRDDNHLVISFVFDKKVFDNLNKNSAEYRYLNAVKNTLTQAVKKR